MSPRTRMHVIRRAARSARVRAGALAAIVVMVVAIATTAAAPAATSNVTVTATVPSTVSLTNNCNATAAWNFGTITPSSTATTATGIGRCQLTFQSNNDTSMLRAYQRDKLGTAMSTAITPWTAQGTTGRTIYTSAMTPGFNAKQYIGSRNGTIMHSEDSGATWTAAVSNPVGGASVFGIASVNATLAYEAADVRNVLRTTDGGANWVDICTTACAALATTQAISDVAAPSAGTVWAITNSGNIIGSTNADQASPVWTLQASFPGVVLDSIAAVDTSTAYVTGNAGKLYKTIDGGTTWNAINAGSFGGTPEDIGVVRNLGHDYVYAACTNGRVMRGDMLAADVTAAGGTWSIFTVAPEADGYRMHGVAMLDKDSVIVAGLNGNVYKTVNGTAGSPTFTRLTTNTDSSIETVAWNAGGFALFGGTASFIGRSVDNGSTWSKLTPAPYVEIADLRAVRAIDATNAYAVGTTVGGATTLIRTTNGGTTWPAVANPGTTSMFGMDFADADNAITVGTGGSILRSSNASAGSPTWTAGNVGYPENLTSVDFVPGTTTAWAVGQGGRIVKTTDGGATWSSQTSGTTINLRGVAAVDALTAFAAGDSGKLLRTTDGGATWSSLTSGTTNYFRGIDAPDAQTFFAVHDGGKVATSTNADAALPASVVVTQYTTAATDSLNSVTALNRNFVAAAGSSFKARQSYDGGVTWTLNIPIGGTHTIFSIDASDANTMWVVGEGGRIYKDSVNVAIPDYGGASTWANAAPSTNLFGVCLQKLAGANTFADWTEDTVTTPNVCGMTDSDPWNAVPIAPVKIAHTTLAGASATVDLVYGIRTSSSQQAGLYSATIVYEAIAPNV